MRAMTYSSMYTLQSVTKGGGQMHSVVDVILFIDMTRQNQNSDLEFPRHRNSK